MNKFHRGVGGSIRFPTSIPFLAVQDSSIGDLVTQSLTETCFDFSVF